MYALPWKMSMAAFYNLRDGTQFNRTIQSPNRTGSGGTVNVAGRAATARALPHVQPARSALGQGHSCSASAGCQFNVDAFNLTNASTVLARQTRQNFAQANYVTRILAPRVVRFGLKVNF